MPDVVSRSAYEVERLDGPFAAVIDTNVALDLYTIHDVAEAIALRDHERVDLRLRRARAAWWIVMALDDAGLNTLGFTEEYRRVLVVRAGQSQQYSMWSRFISDYVARAVAPRWNGVSSDRDAGVRSSQADRLLVQMAVEHGLPVVTCEVGGAVAKAAQAASVPVYTSWEFAPTLGFSCKEAKRRFLERFDAGAPSYAAAWSTRFEDAESTPHAQVEQLCREWIESARGEFEAIWDESPRTGDADQL